MMCTFIWHLDKNGAALGNTSINVVGFLDHSLKLIGCFVYDRPTVYTAEVHGEHLQKYTGTRIESFEKTIQQIQSHYL